MVTFIGMQYRKTTYAANDFDTYWFEKNLQGDIVAVYSEDGTKLISYTYDAWGILPLLIPTVVRQPLQLITPLPIVDTIMILNLSFTI